MNQQELIPHLFRSEYRKIVSVLCRHFGFDRIETAEDITSDTFLTATQTWGLEGVPENPTGWLYRVASNKAKNFLHRGRIFENKIAPEILHGSKVDYSEDIDLSPQNITDSQLQMMFSICHPSLSTEAQIGLSLRILCGFGIEEIADAFLTTRDTINKRLFRAKEKLREERITIGIPDETEIRTRLETVLTTIYLLFNEGYYSVSRNATLRKDFCLEAMRLCHMLIENESTNKPEVNALLSLMCFHASRFDARLNESGETILYAEQNEDLWNRDLIGRGEYFLNLAASGDRISKYHLEAGIAYWHTQKSDSKEKWESILQFYNQLLLLEYSPVAALNRTYALSKANGKAEAIVEAEKLQLNQSHFYFALLGELYSGIDDEKARKNFTMSLTLAKNQTDRATIQKKIDGLTFSLAAGKEQKSI
jgi:RNA polymerase sigma factor (sigma-70 family)